jgi:hypothetical protein
MWPHLKRNALNRSVHSDYRRDHAFVGPSLMRTDGWQRVPAERPRRSCKAPPLFRSAYVRRPSQRTLGGRRPDRARASPSGNCQRAPPCSVRARSSTDGTDVSRSGRSSTRTDRLGAQPTRRPFASRCRQPRSKHPGFIGHQDRAEPAEHGRGDEVLPLPVSAKHKSCACQDQGTSVDECSMAVIWPIPRIPQ